MKNALKRDRFRAAHALLVVLFGAQAFVCAATLADYRARVHDAMIAVDSVVAFGEESEEADESRTFKEVRRLLPATEKIDWGTGQTLVVNNEWLHGALDDYEKNARTLSATDRADALTAVAERLHALEARLAEAGGAARDKDAEKGQLATILRGPDYNQKAAQGSALRQVVKQILEWIQDLFPSLKPISPGASSRFSRAAQIFIIALALAVIGFVLWRYWWSRRGTGWKPVSLRESRVVLGERIASDETAADLLSAAEALARGGDLRGAIRKAYVALLCELGDRKIIRLAQHNTNRDYLQAIRKSAPPQLFQEVQPLTANYERHWYGFEDADETDWNDFRTRCRQALRQSGV
ncbi:MAG TPA: DUF4129 domain-containing protein [Pyrinomonadaceae bacterium]|jgi:hypothetical protein|nr:DUF4129 domain-containing protein [Pyrinomonadaceae bacterium]